jgi:hypothetical protein
MSYDDWESSFREVYDDVPGMATAYNDDDNFDSAYAEALFEAGFTHTSAELDALGYSPDDIAAIREEFFDYMGVDERDFDWQEWREAMGYD